MPFERPTLTEIKERIISDFQSRIENSNSILRRSVLRVMASVYSGAVHLLYGYLQYQKDQLFATTADAENLETIGSEYGITRKAATYSEGSGVATGTTGLTIPAGAELQSENEKVYTVDDDVMIVAGAATIDFTADEAGEDSNDDAGITLSFISPIAGIDSDITVDASGITGGVDKEGDDSLRDRVIARKRQPPHGGAEFDYVTWALEVSGVTRAWSFPQYQGIGTIGLAFVRDDDDSIIPDSEARQDVYDYIIEHTDPLTGLQVGIPATAEPGFYVVDLELESVDFEIDILPNTSALQSSIENNIEELILRVGGPGETLYLTDLVTAISSTSGLTTFRIDTPSADKAFGTNKAPVLGTITFGDY